MQKVRYATNVDLPIVEIWEFIKDMNNWAPMFKGYQGHETINEKESIWTLKGQFGVISRTTKFHNIVTDMVEQQRITGTYKGLNEPVHGFATVSLCNSDNGKTVIEGEVGFEISGVLGAMIGRFIAPWVRSAAEDLVTKMVNALQANVWASPIDNNVENI